MAVKGHSFGAVYPVCIILDILSEVSEKKQPVKTMKITVFDNPTVF